MKNLLKVIFALFVFLVLASALLVTFLDPNVFKGRIEMLAREQGIALDIDGDLGWTLWSGIGITANAIRLSTHTVPSFTIAKFKSADLLMVIGPLLNGDIEIDTITVDGVEIDLVKDEQGEGNWLKLIEEGASDNVVSTPIGNPSESDSQPIALAIDTISLKNSAIRYVDRQGGQRIDLNDINATLSQFNLRGQPFSVELSAVGEIDSSTAQQDRRRFSTQLRHQVTLAKDFSALDVKEGKFTVSVESIPYENFEDSPVNGNYSLSITDLNNLGTINGDVDIAAFNLRQSLTNMGIVLDTADKSALSQFSLETQFQGDKNQLSFSPIKTTLDKSQLSGSVAIVDFSTNSVDVRLTADQINFDHYLAPQVLEQAPVVAAGSGRQSLSTTMPEAGDDRHQEPIPLDALKSINGNFNIAVEQLTIRQMPLDDVELRAEANQGLITVSQAKADAYGGQINATGNLDGRGDRAKIVLDAQLSDIHIDALLSDLELDEKVNLTGSVNGDIKAKTEGIAVDEVQKSLIASGSFTGAEVRFSPLNVEQKFCQLVNLANQVQSPQQSWQQFTEMQKLATTISIANNIVTLDLLDASVEYLTLGGQGNIDLTNNEYDIRLPLKLLKIPPVEDIDDSTTSVAEQFCEIKSNYWVNRSLSLLRCRGSLLTLDPAEQCQFDRGELRELTLDYAEYKLRKKHGDKIDAAEQKIEKKKNELLEKLDEKLGGEGDASSAEQLLKELLKNRN